MLSRFRSTALVGRTGLLTACVALFVATTFVGASKSPIRKLQFDPDAKQVDLFTALEEGTIEVKLIAKNSKEGNLIVENKSDQPVTVVFPEAVVGVQVLKQFGQAGGLGGAGGLGTGTGSSSSSSSQAQPMGMGMGGMGMGGMGMGGMGGMGMGGGFFSVPAEKVALIPLKGVCLAHGKPDPQPRMTYTVIPLESHTDDPVLQETLKLFGTRQVDQMAAQAAVWHLTDNMSWQELAAKQYKGLGVPPRPYFTPAQLNLAQQLVTAGTQRAKERKPENPRLQTDKKI